MSFVLGWCLIDISGCLCASSSLPGQVWVTYFCLSSSLLRSNVSVFCLSFGSLTWTALFHQRALCSQVCFVKFLISELLITFLRAAETSSEHIVDHTPQVDTAFLLASSCCLMDPPLLQQSYDYIGFLGTWQVWGQFQFHSSSVFCLYPDRSQPTVMIAALNQT